MVAFWHQWHIENLPCSECVEWETEQKGLHAACRSRGLRPVLPLSFPDTHPQWWPGTSISGEDQTSTTQAALGSGPDHRFSYLHSISKVQLKECERSTCFLNILHTSYNKNSIKYKQKLMNINITGNTIKTSEILHLLLHNTAFHTLKQ